MSMHANMTPTEIADFELGQLISTIGRITYNDAMDFAEAMKLYQTIEPCLNNTQRDAWQIVLDLMEYDEQQEDVA